MREHMKAKHPADIDRSEDFYQKLYNKLLGAPLPEAPIPSLNGSDSDFDKVYVTPEIQENVVST